MEPEQLYGRSSDQVPVLFFCFTNEPEDKANDGNDYYDPHPHTGLEDTANYFAGTKADSENDHAKPDK